ncbi:MAG: hypothetical protein UY10_C0002G0003 [Microgenomates group bacterium GW2011_GWA2_47_8]|nr:MAG: hypothetical protein UY10_C0002G0003 [Microgenomates group bacterium GW2011_GWA2_47_8]
MDKYKSLFRKIIEITVIFTCSLTPLFWLHGNQIVLGHDSGFRVNSLEYLKSLFYSWDSYHNFGADSSVLKGFLITQLPETIFMTLTKSTAMGQTLTFVFWFLVMSFSMYFSIRKLFPESKFWILRLATTLLYVYNFFILQAWFIVERAKFSAYAALPIVFVITYRALTKKIHPVMAGLYIGITIFFLNGGSLVPYFGGLIITTLITIIILTVIQSINDGLRSIIRTIIFIASSLFFTGFLNAYWLFPQVMDVIKSYNSTVSSLGGVNGVINWEQVVSKNSSVINLLRMQGVPDWYDSLFHPFSQAYLNNPGLIILSFVPIITIVLGASLYLRFRREAQRDQLMLVIFSVLLVGIVFAGGSHEPFGRIYIWFIKNVPGFSIFRSSIYKFGPMVWFSMAFLFGYMVNGLTFSFLKNDFFRRMVGVCAILYILAYHYPFFLGNFFDWNKPFTTRVVVPTYVTEMIDYIRQNVPSNSRILSLPTTDMTSGADGYSWGFWSSYSLVNSNINTTYITDGNPSGALTQSLIKALTDRNPNMFNVISSRLGISYFLWRDDILDTNKCLTANNFAYLKTSLESMPGVHIKKKSELWTLYALIETPRPPVEVISQIQLISDPSIVPIIFNQNNISNENIISADSSLQTTSKENLLSKFADKAAIKGRCILCDYGERHIYEDRAVFPYLNILPGSLFYQLINFKEQLQLRKFSNNPSVLFDIYSSLSFKRVTEINQLLDYGKKKERNRKLIVNNLQEYKKEITNLVDIIQKMSEVEQYKMNMVLSIYLDAQRQVLAESIRKSEFGPDKFIEILDYLNSINRKVAQQMPNIVNQQRYVFNVPDDGEYKIVSNQNIENIIDTATKSMLDSTKPIFFNRGIHILDIYISDSDQTNGITLLDQDSVVLNEYGEKEYSFPYYDDGQSYLLQFNYHIERGNNIVAIITGGTNNSCQSTQIISLEADEKWHKIRKNYTLNDRSQSIKVIFRSYDDSPARITVENLNSIPTNSPISVLLERDFSYLDRLDQPSITVQKIDPTLYSVRLENVSGPYMIKLNELFNNGWRVIPLEDIGEVGKAKDNIQKIITTIRLSTLKSNDQGHFLVDGYANGWLIQNTNAHTLIFMYEPQVMFYIGIMISMLGAGSVLCILVIHRIIKFYKL